MLSRSRRGISRGAGGLVPRNLSATPLASLAQLFFHRDADRKNCPSLLRPCSGRCIYRCCLKEVMLVSIARLGRGCFVRGRVAPFGSQCRRSSHGSTDGRCSGRTCGSDRHGGCRRGYKEKSHVSSGSHSCKMPPSESLFVFVRAAHDSDMDFSSRMGSVYSYQERAPLP